MLMHKLSLLDAVIHASLAKKALLTSLAFLKPRPPCFFGKQSLSQDRQARNLPTWFLGFHQNILVRELRLLQTLLGMLKEDMA